MENVETKEPPKVLVSDTNNATQIRPEEAPAEKKYKFRKFKAYNTNLWNGPRRENTELFRRQDNLHRFDAIASKLLATPYQKKRGRKLFDDFDLQKFGQSIDYAIFGICVVVANADVNDGTRYWPKEKNDDEFNDFAQSIGLDWKRQMSIIEKIQSSVEIDSK